jgi:hypothetical protein
MRYFGTVKSGPEGQISMLTSDMVIPFTTPKNGVITDTATSLQRAQDTGGQAMTWDNANAYVRDLKIGGYSDWRLPTKEELESLITYCKGKGIQVKEGKCAEYYNKIGFKKVQSPVYWSSTTVAGNPNLAWIVSSGMATCTTTLSPTSTMCGQYVPDSRLFGNLIIQSVQKMIYE